MIRSRRTHALLVIATVMLIATTTAPTSAQQATLAEVLVKAGERAALLSDPTRILSCDERYKQVLERVRELVGFDVGGPVGSRSEASAVGMDSREWVAEFVLMPTPGNSKDGLPFREFRDVLTIAGKPVRDGVSRLAKLSTLSVDVGGIVALSASQDAWQYIYGRMVRAIDIPRTAVLFLHPVNQGRFEFKKGGSKTIDGIKTMEVHFKEKTSPSIVRGSGDKDAMSTGTFWIDPATGDVLQSALKSVDKKEVYDDLTVTYAKHAETGLRLPATMIERVMDEEAALRVQGKATYTNWKVVERKK
jgi:hypothetical protein